MRSEGGVGRRTLGPSRTPTLATHWQEALSEELTFALSLVNASVLRQTLPLIERREKRMLVVFIHLFRSKALLGGGNSRISFPGIFRTDWVQDCV